MSGPKRFIVPLMFVIFVNDHLADAANGEINTALYTEIQRFFVLLSVLAKLYSPPFLKWMNERDVSKSNLIYLKCKILTVTHKKQSLKYNYNVNEVLLTRVAEEKESSSPAHFRGSNVLILLCRKRIRWTLYLSLGRSQPTMVNKIP